METTPDEFRSLSVNKLDALLDSEIPISPDASKRVPFFPMKFGLKKLESSLKDTIRKIKDAFNYSEEHVKRLDYWISNSRLIVEKQKLTYEKEIEASGEIKRKLTEQLKEVSAQNEKAELKRERINRETSRFVEELGKLREELNHKEKRRAALYEELQVLQKRNDEFHTILNQSITKRSADLQRIKTIIDTYERRLGIKFIRDKGSIKCVYKYVYPENHEKEFYFVASFKDGAFNVDDCSDELQSMRSLVALLNRNKDYFWFVKSVRRSLVSPHKN